MSEICFFCQREIQDNTDPHFIAAYRVCPDCHKAMSDGIPVISVRDEPGFQNQGPICRIKQDNKLTDMYPTGEWGGFSETAISRLFGPERLEAAKSTGYLLIDPDAFQAIKDIYKNTMMPAELPTQNPEDAGMLIPE